MSEADKAIMTFDNLRLAAVRFNKNPIKSLLSIPLEYDDSEARKYLGWERAYDLKKIISSFIEELQIVEKR